MRTRSVLNRALAGLVATGLATSMVVAAAGAASAAPGISLTPDTQTIASGQSSELAYTGATTNLLEYFINGVPSGTSAEADVLTTSGSPNDIVIPWDWFGSTSDQTLTIRVYNQDFDGEGTPPAYTDPYAASADIVFSGTGEGSTGVVSTPTLNPMTVGTPFIQGIDFTNLTSGFDFTNGGAVDVTGLPDGLTATLLNPANPGDNVTASGAPDIQISGTPTTAGTAHVTFSVTDANGVTGSATTTLVVAPEPAINPLSFGILQATVPHGQSIDFATESVGFNWQDGGQVSFTRLPGGLTATLLNPEPGQPGYSAQGEAPQIRISGTPSSVGSGTTTVVLADLFGNSATETIDYTVHAASTATSAPTHIGPGGTSVITWSTAWPVTNVVVFSGTTVVGTYTPNGSSANISYDDFASVGDIYSSRALTVRVYNSNQWQTGDPTPTAASAYDAATTLTLDPTPLTLAPATAAISQGENVEVTYTGPDTRAYAIFDDGALVEWGAASDVFDATTHKLNIAWSTFGDSSLHTVDVRVYDTDAADLSGAPAFGDTFAASSEVTINPFVNSGHINSVSLPNAWVGVPYSQTVNIGDVTTGFNWTNGGGVLIDSLPAGLSYELLNPAAPGSSFSTAGDAPIIRIYGTPTTSGDVNFGLGVTDDLGNNDSASIPLSVGTVSVGFSAHTVVLGGSTNLTYTGPSDLLVCSYVPDVSAQPLSCFAASDLSPTLTYASMRALFGGSILNDQHVAIKVYGESYPGADKVYSDPSLASDVAVFKTTPSISLPNVALLQQGVAFSQTIDSSTFTTGFDWTNGGTVTATGLPDGLSASVANAVGGGSTSPAGQSPVLQIAGTPTTNGPVTFTVTVTDSNGSSLSLPVTVTVHVPSTASANPTHIGPATTASVSYATANDATLVAGFIGGQLAFATPVSSTSGSINVAWNDLTAFGDIYSSRTVTLRVYNTQQWSSGDAPVTTASAYDVATSLTLDPQSPTLSADAANVSHLGSASFTYTGPSTWLGCVFVDQVLDKSSCGAISGLTDPNSITWSTYGGTTNKVVTVRVYAMASDASTDALTWTTPFAATASTTFTGYIAPALTAPSVANLRVGVAAPSTSYDIAGLAVGFDWTNGGTVSSASMPDGVAWTLTNAADGTPNTSIAGHAPVLRLTGTPTTAGVIDTTLTVTDGSGNTAHVTVPIPVISATVLPVPELGAMQVGVEFTTQITVPSDAAGWNWHGGGTSSITGLPDGLSYVILGGNESDWTGPGVTPVVRISGIPTTSGSGSFSWTVTDADGGTATVSVPYSIAPGIAPTDPAPITVGGPMPVTFTVTGIDSGANVVAGPLVTGVDSVGIAGSQITVDVNKHFSGTFTQTIVSTFYGVATTVHLKVTVKVVAVTHATFTPGSGKTVVRWKASPNASAYVVRLSNGKACRVAAPATHCAIAGVFGPRTKVVIIAVGGNGQLTTSSVAYVSPRPALVIGTVYFAPDASGLSASARKQLLSDARVIAKQGFAHVSVSGYAAHLASVNTKSDKAQRLRLAATRATVVRAELLRDLKALHAKVTIRVINHGADHLSAHLSAKAAHANRRASIAVS